MTAERPAWTAIRARLEAAGFHPTKTRGQNFLVDANMARAIARDAEVGAGDRVLEVGPGAGSLSLELASLGVELLCVEVDARLAEIARELLAPHPSARVLLHDVLDGKHRLAPVVSAALWSEGPWHLVANLPYSISGPLLAVLARHAPPPASATVLVQREVAERLVAAPGSAAYGPLGIKLGLRYRARFVRAVGPQLFWPRPRVESAVVRLERRAEPNEAPDPAERDGAFDRLVDGLFQRRRKALRGALGAHLGRPEAAAVALERAGLAGERRAETLDREELLRLASALGADPGGVPPA